MITERRITKAIVSLQSLQPFFAYIAMHMKIQPTESLATMGVDANFNMYYNIKFVEETVKTDDLIIGCVCHETLHLALNHIGRIGSRLHVIANIAQDMVVNMICETNNINTLKGDDYVTYDKNKDTGTVNLTSLGIGKVVINKISEKPWETVYEEIINIMKNKGKDPQLIEKLIEGMMSKGTIILDEHFHESFNKMTKEEQNKFMEDIKNILVDGYTYSKQIGKVPGGLERYIKEILSPKIPWQAQLMKYIKNGIEPKDWTYRRPHRKSYNLDIYIPSVLKENMNVNILVDTSGSIDRKSYTEFISEIYNMMRVIPNIKVWIAFIDTKIRNEYEMTSNNREMLLSIKGKGGGGTDLEQGLDYVKDNKRDCPVTIVLTDGYTECTRKPNFYPFDVIWCICEEGMSLDQANTYFKYGKVIKM